MEPATQAAPDYFIWEVPGQPVVVHIRLDVIDRMAAEILRGFEAVPKRGAEVGGILVGVIQPGDVSTVRIEDFDPVPCKYGRGPSYLLTESESMLFDEACQRRNGEGAGQAYVVGYYRSHTRDGLALEQEDIALLDRVFRLPSQVALVVKPFATKPSVGGFFVRLNGRFPAATPLEFPFRRPKLTGEEPRLPLLQEEKQKENMPDARARSAAREVPPDRRRSKSRAGMWLVAAFVFLLLGVLLGYQASRITAPRRASDFAMSLAVERTGQNLTVHWNPGALAIRSASNGVLEIDEGGETQHVELDRANLNNGSMVFRNASDKVRFRLVVYLEPGLSVTESVDWQR